MARVETHTATRKEHHCQRCSEPITKGQTYYNWSPGFRVRPQYQHAAHGYPRASQTTGNDKLSTLYGAYESIEDAVGSVEKEDPESLRELASVVSGAKEEVEGVAEEYRESASNIEDGFGHSTFASEEAEENGSQCDDAAQEMESVAETLESAAQALEEALDDLAALGLDSEALPENPEGDIQAAIKAYGSALDEANGAISEAEGLSCPL